MDPFIIRCDVIQTYGGPALLPVLPENVRTLHGAPAAHMEGAVHVQAAIIHCPPQSRPVTG